MKYSLSIILLLATFTISSQNLIDTSDWISGTSGATTNFSLQGTASQSSRITMMGPYGNQVTVWQAQADGASGMNGGFEHKGIITDTNKSYRVTYWMRSSGNNNCVNYAAFTPYYTNGGLVQPFVNENGGNVSWPYFSSINLPNDQWFLIVGYIRPNGATDTGSSGVYDPSQGSVSNIPSARFATTDFIFPSNVAQISTRIRTFMWSCGSGEKMFIYDPRVEELNNELPLASILYNGNNQDTTPPTPPIITSSAKTETTVNINWSGATDNVGIVAYKVFRNGTLLTTLANNTSYQATGLSANTAYTFTVTASDAVGNNSPSSNSLSVITNSIGGSTPTSNSNFWTQSGSNINYATGNVGIGTSNPGTYKLAVNGNIHAKEVKVDLIGWPDYVFKENYKLPTLEEVEQHIKDKGHLINIPSAKEVEENGIELGEMNKLLLEKIEELTLYILDQEKRIQKLEIK